MAIFEIMLSVWLGENSYGRRELGVSGGLRRCDLERAAIAIASTATLNHKP